MEWSARCSLDLKAGPERSFVWPRRAFPLLARDSAAGRRSRTGVAGFGTLVEVVKEGGAGIGPSMVWVFMGSISTALGG